MAANTPKSLFSTALAPLFMRVRRESSRGFHKANDFVKALIRSFEAIANV
jgi:hypothetical protein